MIRVSGTDIGVGPSTLLKAMLDSSDMMLKPVWRSRQPDPRLEENAVGRDGGFVRAE
jgi:hypothetical protein